MINIDLSAIRKRGYLISHIDSIFPQGSLIDIHTHAEGANIFAMANHRYRSTNALEDLAMRMKNLGISAYAVFPHPSAFYYSGLPNNVRLCESNKTALEEFPYQAPNTSLMMHAGRFGHRALPFFIIDPINEIDNQVSLLKGFLKQDVVYGLKAHTLGDTFLASELIGSAFMDVAQEYNLPVLIHTDADTNFWGSPLAAVELAKRYPNVRFCLAHAAGFNIKALDEISQLTNAYIDCSPLGGLSQMHASNPIRGSLDLNYINKNELIDYLFNRFPQNLLWGTDHPYTYGGGAGIKYDGSLENEVSFLNTLRYRDSIARINTLNFLFGKIN